MTENEYIERDKAIDALTERNLVAHMDSVNDGLVASCHRSAQRIIENIPAAEVRPVAKGAWHGSGDGYADGYLVFDEWECPFCGKYFLEWDEKPDWNFCPNCGADMREES